MFPDKEAISSENDDVQMELKLLKINMVECRDDSLKEW